MDEQQQTAAELIAAVAALAAVADRLRAENRQMAEWLQRVSQQQQQQQPQSQSLLRRGR